MKFTNDNINEFVPLGEAILVKCTNPDKTTSSGIILVQKESFAIRPDRGVVLHVGEEVTTIEKNDFVFFNNQSGYDVFESEDALYILLREDSILGLQK